MVVMGFPCNQFGKQEPGTNEEVLEFVQSKYDVTFPMFAKIEVNGDDAAPLYQLLTDGKPITWNFAKFLVDGDGKVVRRYEPKTTAEELTGDLEALLG